MQTFLWGVTQTSFFADLSLTSSTYWSWTSLQAGRVRGSPSRSVTLAFRGRISWAISLGPCSGWGKNTAYPTSASMAIATRALLFWFSHCRTREQPDFCGCAADTNDPVTQHSTSDVDFYIACLHICSARRNVANAILEVGRGHIKDTNNVIL